MKLKLTPDACFVVLLILSGILHKYFPVTKFLIYPFNYFGVLVSLTGIFIVARANTLLIQHKTSIKPFENPVVLISTGIFRFSRNPVYLGMLSILTGIELFLGSLSVLVFPLIFFGYFQYIIKIEEKLLEHEFGETYRTYKGKVRRWL